MKQASGQQSLENTPTKRLITHQQVDTECFFLWIGIYNTRVNILSVDPRCCVTFHLERDKRGGCEGGSVCACSQVCVCVCVCVCAYLWAVGDMRQVQ